jgi:hypothetical protein
MLVATRILPENSRVPASSNQRQEVALSIANKISYILFAAFPLPELSASTPSIIRLGKLLI